MTWFVHRKDDGSIAFLGREAQKGYNEEALADNDPAIVAFFTQSPAQVALATLQANDAQIFRALEVIVDLLLGKNVTAGQPLLVAGDFPQGLRQLYLARKALRAQAGVP